MNIMSLDAEYNQPSGKTIQIGAAIFNSKTGQLIDKFESYVDPKEKINDGKDGNTNIIELTGIKDSDVLGAPSIQEVYEMLKNFHKKIKCFKNPLVWGSGSSNDSQHIYNEVFQTIELKKQNPNFMGHRVIDVKGLYQSIQIFNNNQVRGGLKTVCEKLNIGFEGEAHRALNDAINTFRVWHFLIKKFNIN